MQKGTSQSCMLPQPSGINVSAITNCSATLSWNPVPGATFYRVQFKEKGAPTPPTKIDVGLDTSYVFTGLNSPAIYLLGVAAFCTNTASSGFKSLRASIPACAPPIVTDVRVNDPFSVTISWNSCSSTFNRVRIKKISESQWTYLSTGSNQTLTLNALTEDSSYIFQVNGCSDTSGNWSLPGTFTLPPRPNILLIILDDARFDCYSCNGGPSFFQSTNIDRIANEGANFTSTFCSESYCIPSRGSIVTGLYPHKNGATNNSSIIYSNLPTTAKILDSAGYYTGWIGKYHMATKPQAGYDYWFATKVNTGTDEYHNLQYNYNGVLKTVPGHDTDILTDTMLAFVDRNYNKHFFATLAYHAPHSPCIPQDEYDGLFSGDVMPVPADTVPYNENFPSFLYHLPPIFYIEPSSVSGEYEKYYELLAGVDASIGQIIAKLETLNILNNTLIIFTSDNGLLIGEHLFENKRLAYDPSIRVPLFVRYPFWFADSVKVSNQMAMNVDIAPSLLEAAGVHGNYSFDGVSIRKLANHSATRTAVYYEYVYDSYTPSLPYIKSVRTPQAKLVEYGCNQSTREFFDLTLDPNEDSNRINDDAYTTTIQSLTTQLNQLRLQLKDTAGQKILTCFLANQSQKEVPFISEEEASMIEDQRLLLFPDPASVELNIGYQSEADDPDTRITIYNAWGSVVGSQALATSGGSNLFTISLPATLSDGCYFLSLHTSGKIFTAPFIIDK